MTVFRVWAPEKRQVDLVLGDERLAMQPAEDGWWQLDAPQAGAGADYRFALDGGESLPDPRSRWQPEGIHGPSRVLDPGAFHWNDAGWQPTPLASAVIYELHTGAFTEGGTFESAIERLDELVDLGITHVELLPVNAFPGSRGWGYDGVDLYAPHQAYGGPHGLARLVDACHARGLAVILDVVYNHLGPDGNYLGQFGPYFTDKHATPWGDAVNYDAPGSDEVRRFIIDNALMWLRDYHIDGLRLDAVHSIIDTSAYPILEELADEVRQLAAGLGKAKFLIAESDLNDPRLIRPPEIGGYGLDAQWSDDFHHALHSALTGETSGYYADFGALSHLADALRQGYVYAGRRSAHRGRRHGRQPTGIAPHRLLGYLQNHDQIGNRAQGERITALVSPQRAMIGAAFVLLGPFVPMLFMGEEWGASTPFQYFTDHQDQELGKLVSQGRAQEFVAFGWDPAEVPDPQDPQTFQRSVLRWDERQASPHHDLLDWHRALIHLRRSTPDFAPAWPEDVRVDEQAGWLAFRRGSFWVAANLGQQPALAPLGLEPTAQIILASGDDVRMEREGVHLPPDSVAILKG